MSNRGFTLIELLVVTGIIGILAIALGFSFEGWQGRYRVESRIKEVESDLNKARSRAMQRNRVHFFSLDADLPRQYTVYEDTDPGPDGNRSLDTALDTTLPTYPKTIEYDLSWNGGGDTVVTFDTRGLISPERSICIFTDFDGDTESDVDPDYDCLVISQTRISIGKLNSQVAGDCGTAICDAR
jgi:prepilin-type N-terminal cleavage/methylation domain-containing protein